MLGIFACMALHGGVWLLAEDASPFRRVPVGGAACGV